MFKLLTLIFFVILLCFACSSKVYAQEFDTINNSKYLSVSIGSVDSMEVYERIDEILFEKTSNGFINAGVDSVISQKQITFVRFYLGKQYKWRKYSLEFEGNIPFSIHSPQIKSGDVVNINKIYRSNEKIITELENNGFPFAQIDNEIGTDSIYFDLRQRVVANKRYTFDTIACNERNISSTFLSRYLGLRPGKTYNEELIKKTPKKINQLSFLNLIKKPSVTYGTNLARPELWLRAEKSNYFNGLLGIIPNDKKKGSYVITGDIELALTNAIGKGESLIVQWKKNDQYSQQLNGEIKWPYIFTLPLGMQSSIQMLKEDTSYVSVNWKAGLFIYFSGANSIFGYYKNNQTILLTPADSTTISATNNYGTGVALEIKQTDNLLNPAKGYELYLDIGAGKRNMQNQRDINNKKTSSYFEGKLHLSGFIPIYKKWVLQLKNSFVRVYSIDTLYKNELYRVGGLKTLRGFGENKFYSNYYNISTLEIRWLFEEYSHIKIFADAGWINANYTGTQTTQKTISIGTGINLHTKAGIFSIGYALGKLNKNTMKLNNAKIHFGYINKF